MAKKKETKKKTPTQLKKKYKAISRATFFGEFLAIFTPFAVIGIANWNKYFVQYNGTKMSIAAVLAFALMGIAVWLISKKKFENSYLAIIIGWGVVMVIFFLLGEIINDIAVIMLFGWFGLIGADVLDHTSKAFDKKAQDIQKGIDAANEEMTKNEYINEKKEASEKKSRKVKIKVKKEETSNQSSEEREIGEKEDEQTRT